MVISDLLKSTSRHVTPIASERVSRGQARAGLEYKAPGSTAISGVFTQDHHRIVGASSAELPRESGYSILQSSSERLWTSIFGKLVYDRNKAVKRVVIFSRGLLDMSVCLEALAINRDGPGDSHLAWTHGYCEGYSKGEACESRRLLGGARPSTTASQGTWCAICP